ncbi:HNH endonuclease [Psychrobacter cryohalolentis]|uniref:HNH endonuclease n=1 Tax=Psychrobacter sp. D2 TaxID=2759702 RepID=UPI0015E62BB9|nr:HNH endonuclease [Psychrobacter sp. D2]MBA2056374.1 HNH endonuclease [Psychrobacter sp. D2]
MSDKPYSKSRPSIPAELRRAIEVEAGHTCAIKGCYEHTYLEIHHIDLNRENNTLENLILLCDKHHKMSHAEVIDRKALREYKKLLNNNHDSTIIEKIEELKALIKNQKASKPIPQPTNSQPIDPQISRLAPHRSDVLHFALYHVAIAFYEKRNNLYFEHQVEFIKDESHLILDALRQNDNLSKDIIIEVHYIRKSYLDSIIYSQQIEKKIEIYKLLTGREARGVLLIVVSKEKMKTETNLQYTYKGVEVSSEDITIEVFSCDEIGFHPGSVSAATIQSDLE